MTLPLNKKQKQLVEKSMDLVPIMIRSMTRTAAYVTEEEQQELCQIGYLALCRSAVGFEEGRSFQPYAKTIIRHAIFDYWRKIARDRSMLCSLDEASSEDEHLHYRDLFATVYKGNIIKNLIMDCQSYTKYRPNETTGGIFVSWRRKEELPTGA